VFGAGKEFTAAWISAWPRRARVGRPCASGQPARLRCAQQFLPVLKFAEPQHDQLQLAFALLDLPARFDEPRINALAFGGDLLPNRSSNAHLPA
jgi:hypothetical protein